MAVYQKVHNVEVLVDRKNIFNVVIYNEETKAKKAITDEIDKIIVAAFNSKERETTERLARSLNISPNRIDKILKPLVDEKFLNIVPEEDYLFD
jgi:predicted HTH transcriptional regulator